MKRLVLMVAVLAGLASVAGADEPMVALETTTTINETQLGELETVKELRRALASVEVELSAVRTA